MTKSELKTDKICDRAIVIGGSIAGMLAARVLADYFASVTIVQTDKCLIANHLL